MLAASWALVHPPWIPTSRIPLRWDVLSRSVSQSKASTSRPRHPFTKSPPIVLRRSHVSQVPIDNLTNLVTEGNYQLAEKVRIEMSELGGGVYEGVLEDLVREYRTEDIIQEFRNRLTLLPDAQSPDQDAFRGLRQLLQASPDANLPLIIEFGVACASKGYTVIVNEEIISTVARHADASVYTQFVKDVEAQTRDHLARSELQRSMPLETVFEDASDDYKIVNSEATPPPPDILDLITANLPEKLPRPLPHDAMVLEDESDYDYVSYVPTSSPTSLPDALAQLVSDHRYEEAYKFLMEIQDVGDVPIHNSPVYEQAAQAALDPDFTLTPEERLIRFTSWISLIPPIHLARPPAQFLGLRQLIFRGPNPNHILASQFATILASKGYGGFIIPHAVPLIMRFAPESFSHQFVLDFERADETYWTKYRPDEVRARVTNTKRDLRAAAVKHLTYSNRLKTAISLLPKIDDSFRLIPTIYDTLIQNLQRSRTFTSTEQITLVESLRDQKTRFTNAGSNDVDKSGAINVPNSNDKFLDLSPTDFGPDIGRAILYLRKCLASKGNLPDPLALSEWFEFYTWSSSKRKRRAVTTLRNKALQCGGRSAETYLFAEMHYYQRTGNHDLVIKTFVDHFYLIGVPQDDVLGHYHRIKQGLASKYHTKESPIGDQLHQYMLRQAERYSRTDTSVPHVNDNPSFKLARRKLWPKHSHTTLVWHTLLNLTSSDADADKLYEKLVQIAAVKSGASLATSDNVSPPPPPSWTHNVGIAAFTPFIRKLMVGFGASRGAMVLSDMLKVGLEPTLHQFTELAGLYARLGDASRAFMILDRMEANKAKLPGNSDVQDIPVTASPSAPQDRRVGPPFPAPDVVFYTSLLRGFFISRDLQAIDEVDRRLKAHHQYTPGDHPALDDVYANITRLRKELEKSGWNNVDD